MKKKFTTDTTAASILFNAPVVATTAIIQDTAEVSTDTAEPLKQPQKTIIRSKPGTPHACPDGEKRTHRYQITCKPSIAEKAAALAKKRKISVNNLFEVLVLQAWEWQEER